MTTHTATRQNYLSNHEIIHALLIRTQQPNTNQFAIYLTKKYHLTVARQQFNQLEKNTSKTITHLLLRELLEYTQALEQQFKKTAPQTKKK